MKPLLLILALLLASCEDRAPVDVPPSKRRTDGAMEQSQAWVETETRPVLDKVYRKYETATEIRWVEVLDSGVGMSRVMGRNEVIPK